MESLPKKRPFKWTTTIWGQLLLLLLIVIIIGVGYLAYVIQGYKKYSLRFGTTNNSRQLGSALIEFESKFGNFPNDATAKAIIESTGTSLDLSGASSNAALRQLIAAEVTPTEAIFDACIYGATSPDGIITPGEALKKGEVGFSYISSLSSKNDPSTPILLTPMIPGTTKFDPKPFENGGRGYAIVLHIDNSVRAYDIAKDGHIYDKGIDLLSPKNPIWKGKAPDIRYPE
jgi:hypothetical protein